MSMVVKPASSIETAMLLFFVSTERREKINKHLHQTYYAVYIDVWYMCMYYACVFSACAECW